MTTAPREESRAESSAPRPDDEAARRSRLRRFGLLLASGVAGLVLFAVGYVALFDRVLVDRERPPAATSVNPRVLAFELLLALAIAVVLTAWIVRARRGARRGDDGAPREGGGTEESR